MCDCMLMWIVLLQRLTAVVLVELLAEPLQLGIKLRMCNETNNTT